MGCDKCNGPNKWTRPRHNPLFKPRPNRTRSADNFFSIANAKFDLFVATPARFMVAVIVAMVASYNGDATRTHDGESLPGRRRHRVRHPDPDAWHDETFIKMKPTIVYTLFRGDPWRRLAVRAAPLSPSCSTRMFNLTAARAGVS